MIPLRDATRRPARFPLVTVALIVANVLVFLWEIGADDASILRFAVVPAVLMHGHAWLTPFTAMFLHGGFTHIAGNMVFLQAFAPAVEDTMGRARFLVFYVLGGLAATATQVALDPASTVPQLGASGAIAAVMGAFLVTYPADRIKVLMVLGWFVDVAYLPAFLLVGVWLVLQLLNQTAAVVHAQTGGVAYAAHVGGCLFGMLTARVFERNAERAAAFE